MLSGRQPEDYLLPWEFDRYGRILIIAPHPDDEVLAAGGVIATALKSHTPSEIRIIVATNGDASYISAFLHGSHTLGKYDFRRLATIRQQESLSALVALGMSAEQVRFWGFPDRGLALLWQSREITQLPYHSPTTGYTHSEQALNSPILSFTAKNLLELFNKELHEFRPTSIVFPHPQDAHSDHSALAGFTLMAVKRFHTQTRLHSPKLLAYRTWLNSGLWLTGFRSQHLSQLLVKEESSLANLRCVILTPEVLEMKRQALQSYRSQRQSAGQVLRDASKNKYEVFTICDLAL